MRPVTRLALLGILSTLPLIFASGVEARGSRNLVHAHIQLGNETLIIAATSRADGTDVHGRLVFNVDQTHGPSRPLIGEVTCLKVEPATATQPARAGIQGRFMNQERGFGGFAIALADGATVGQPDTIAQFFPPVVGGFDCATTLPHFFPPTTFTRRNMVIRLA